MRGSSIALCAAISIGESGAAAPEWVHLLPAGVVRTIDGRGPYRVGDVTALMAASLADGKLVLDENHATDLAAPKGGSAPARGWIVDLQSRADGIWGRVEWVDDGSPPAWRQYRGISPAIIHDRNGTVRSIARASLTNTPNLAGLIALHHQENDMDLRAVLIEALGLPSDASDEAIIAAVQAKMKGSDDPAVALQAALSPIALAAGLAADASGAAIAAGVRELRAGEPDTASLVALQSELADTAGRLATLTEATARKDAVAFVDGAIGAGRVGVKPMRDRYITMHMADAAGTELLVNALPAVKAGATLAGDPATDENGLGAADSQVIALMGLDRKAYETTLSGLKQVAL